MGPRRRLAVLDAPSNLGLRPLVPGCAPGCAKAPGALRDYRLLDRLGAADAGVVTPPRYVPDWDGGLRTRNSAGLVRYTPPLAERIGRLLDDGTFPVVLGGDCSILLGAALALRRRGRYGLVYVDAHGDFRHPGNAAGMAAAAGEDLALVTGRGQEDLADIDGLRPYISEADIVVLGIRETDAWYAELAGLGLVGRGAAQCRGEAATAAATEALRALDRPELDGYWVHFDVDVLDPAHMPAVDHPEAGGLDWSDVARLLTPLVADPAAVGLQLTIFDPDLDPDGSLAARLAALLVEALTGAASAADPVAREVSAS